MKRGLVYITRIVYFHVLRIDEDPKRTRRVAHFRKYLGAAAALNTAIFVVEGMVGYRVGSLSLITDAVHNFSDEMALIFLYLAAVLPVGMSRNSQRFANILNSVGLICLSVLVVWQAIERLSSPTLISGWVPVGVGIGAALANWGVARLLREPSRHNASVRLAYVHNLGDIVVSLFPVAAGLLVSVTNYSLFDPLCAIGIGLWLIWSTVSEIASSHDELLWPKGLMCDHESAHVILK